MNRIKVADALRGFSLLGIFLANLLIFQYGLTGKEYIEFYHLNSVNTAFYHIIKILIEGSFIPIFAMLFGFSIHKMYQSMKRKQLKRPRVKLYRRAFFLLIIGIIHMTWIWEGDILTGYAISMMVLIPFISLGKNVFKWVAIAAVGLLVAFFVFSFFNNNTELNNKQQEKSYVKEITELYQQGSYSDIISGEGDMSNPKFNELKASFNTSPVILLLFVCIYEASIFSIGIYISHSRWFEKDANDFWSSKLFIYLTPVVILIKTSYLWIGNKILADAFNFISGIFLAVCYMAIFKYIYQKHANHIIFRGLESIGKMSLTFYIFQSVIGVLIFYGFGLGQFGTDTLVYKIIIFIILFVFQVVIAFWYQKYLRYGPLEYILRLFTYWSFKPTRWK